ncbi:hypothetical protein Tco_0908006 [Tanacetum coccineum]|uniref:Uncharacterized protein n=1 Tax=Tanacetum coccineum TaxID=301880 RepID=A0ABQ5CKW5_9ASTR
MLLTASKRVHKFPARIPANRKRFYSSSSSPPRKRHRASPYSSSSATHSLSSVSARPSREKCRSFTADFLLVRADRLPSYKRLRDLSSTYCHEVSVEVSTKVDIKDSIETGVEGDIERDTKSNIDLDILADIEADIAAEAASAIKVDVAADAIAAPEVPDDIPVPIIANSGSRETFEIGLDIVIYELYDHIVEFPAQRITYIVEEQRAQETSAITANTERARLLDKIRVLEGSNIGIRDALGVEREMTTSVERHLGYILEELRRIRMAYQYDRADFRKLETFYGDKEGYSNDGGNGNGNSRGNENGNGGGNRNRNRMNVGAGGNALVARTVGIDGAHEMSWKDLMKLIIEVYCPRNEIQNLESELWNLSVKGTDVDGYMR